MKNLSRGVPPPVRPPIHHTTFHAAGAVVTGESRMGERRARDEAVSFDPLVSKHEVLQGSRPLYRIRDVGEETLRSMALARKIAAQLRSAYPPRPGNMAWSIFESGGDAFRRATLGRDVRPHEASPNWRLDSIRAEGWRCMEINAAAFAMLVRWYAESGPAPCLGVYLLVCPQEIDHTLCAVHTADGEWVVHDYWVPAFEAHLLEDDRFWLEAIKTSGLSVAKSWHPGEPVFDSLADLLEVASQKGPLASGERPTGWFDGTYHWSEGLAGHARAIVEGVAPMPRTELESLPTPSQCAALGRVDNERVIYRAPSGDTYNGDLVRKSFIKRLKRVEEERMRAGFPERHVEFAKWESELKQACRAADLGGLDALLAQRGHRNAAGVDPVAVTQALHDLMCVTELPDHVKLVDRLAGAAAQLHQPGGEIVLAAACETGKSDALIDVLIVHGARWDTVSQAFGAAPAHVLCRQGRVAQVAGMLRSGVDVDLRDPEGMTLLHHAALAGQIEVARCLVAAGATVDAQGGKRVTPICVAARRGHWQLVYFLLKRGSRAEPTADGTSLAAFARGHGCRDVIDTLQRMLAEALGDLPCNDRLAESLLRAGVDVNAVNDRGETPLILASRQGRLTLVMSLLAHGASVGCRSQTGRTALQEATEAGHAEIARLLVSADQ